MVIPSMTKTAKALQLAQDSGVIVVSMPGHTTHRVQPMDVAFSPLRSCYIEEIENWLRANPGRYVAQAKVAVIFGYAYGKAATVVTAISAFRSTGIWPVNRYAFQDHHFFPSVANTSGAAFVQPVHGESQEDARASQAFHREQKMEIHICYFPWRKITPLKSSYCLQYSKKPHRPKVYQKATERTFSP